MVTLIISSLIEPPSCNLLLALIGAVCLKFQRRLGQLLIALALISLYLFSTPLFSTLLLRPLATYPPLQLTHVKQRYPQVKAIVVLASGNRYAPEYRGRAPTNHALARLRYAALLHTKTGLPILLSGGQPAYETEPEAKVMQHVLEQSFHLKARWLETHSMNTFENAKYSAKILQAQHIQHIFLVTSTWHMTRALWAFRRVGLQPIAAPTDYINTQIKITTHLWSWLPHADTLSTTAHAFHEYIGLLWYRIAYS